MKVPLEILTLLGAFAPLFSDTVWEHAQKLLLGAILAPGKRTVTSALTVLGLDQEPHFNNYHRVLNRAVWSSLQASKILLGLLLSLAPLGPLVIGVDDTIERRRGEKIKAIGVYRDAVRSSKKHVIRCFGLKWLSMMLVVRVPIINRVWGLPFLTSLCWPENKDSKKPYKSSIDRAGVLIQLLARWLPKRALVLVVDGAFAAVKLAHICRRRNITMISRLRWDAALFHEPGSQPKGKRGRKPLKGKRQRRLREWANRSDTPWEEVEVAWYGGTRKKVQVFSRTALWYTPKEKPVPIRYVLVRDPEGKLDDEVLFTTNLAAAPTQLVEWFVMRWSVEVTFEEVRAHLGVETQRQWSDKAIARTTPILFGLFSIVTLAALRLAVAGKIPMATTAWYAKSLPTFSDCLALVRLHLWRAKYFVKSSDSEELTQLQTKDLNHLLHCLTRAA